MPLLIPHQYGSHSSVKCPLVQKLDRFTGLNSALQSPILAYALCAQYGGVGFGTHLLPLNTTLGYHSSIFVFFFLFFLFFHLDLLFLLTDLLHVNLRGILAFGWSDLDLSSLHFNGILYWFCMFESDTKTPKVHIAVHNSAFYGLNSSKNDSTQPSIRWSYTAPIWTTDLTCFLKERLLVKHNTRSGTSKRHDSLFVSLWLTAKFCKLCMKTILVFSWQYSAICRYTSEKHCVQWKLIWNLF